MRIQVLSTVPPRRCTTFSKTPQGLVRVQRGPTAALHIIPSPSIIEVALRAARRVNDHATAVRMFEGIRYKEGTNNNTRRILTGSKVSENSLVSVCVFVAGVNYKSCH